MGIVTLVTTSNFAGNHFKYRRNGNSNPVTKKNEK